jgi:membrane-bound serine protease (ClpP class)
MNFLSSSAATADFSSLSFRFLRARIMLFLVPLLFITCALPAQAFKTREQPVVQLRVRGPIIPIVAQYVERGIKTAEEQEAICLILMDTPGGLDKSMRDIIQRILDSRVPVVVYVYPEGARAASAGVYILYSAHVAAMAPGTNLGAAHPVSLDFTGGGSEKKEDKTMTEKITNDAVAYIKALAQRRGRNEIWAEEAVRKSVSITSKEALEEGVIDLVAKDPFELIKSLEGRKIRLHREDVVLSPAQSPPKPVEMTGIERFLLIISDPSIALILMMLGLSGLAYEFMSPGAVLPGVVGGICFILALYSLGSLPINYAGLFLIIFSVLLFIADIKAQSHGVLTAGGIISLILGTVLLIPAGYPYLAISRAVTAAITIITSAFFIFITAMVAKSLKRTPITGEEGLMGMSATALADLAPEGLVRLPSETWKACAEGEPVKKGEKVRIVALNGLTLTVRKEATEKEA